MLSTLPSLVTEVTTISLQVLIKKSYADKVKRSKQRNWQLQMMDREMDVAMATANQEGAEQDYQEFLEDLEEDKNYRKNVNIFFSEALFYSFMCTHSSTSLCACCKHSFMLPKLFITVQ